MSEADLPSTSEQRRDRRRATRNAVGITERQVALLRALPGARDVDIADLLGLSVETVATSLKRLYRDIGVDNRSGAVAWGFRNGVIT